LTDGRGFVYEALVATTYISGTEPQAAFEPSAWILDVGQQVTLTNQSSGSEPLAFLWDLGDGESSTLESPVHAYDLPGPYTVVLTTSNTCGTDLHTEELTVVCDAPAAAFTWTAEDLLVSFANESEGMFALDYEWRFGDGAISLESSPTHTYDLPGAYTVTLSAVDLCGSSVYTDVLQLEQPHFLYLPVVRKR
jgi:PKD repeat protein